MITFSKIHMMNYTYQKNKNKKHHIPLWGMMFLIIILHLPGCQKVTPTDESQIYNWEIDLGQLETSPKYENGFYYTISFENLPEVDLTVSKIRETNGEVIFQNTFASDIPIRGGRPSLHLIDNKLVFNWDRVIYQIDKLTGELLGENHLENFIWNLKFDGERFTACSFSGDPSNEAIDRFKFYEIIYENGHFIESLIHTEHYDLINGKASNGTPPMYCDGSWIMNFSTVDENDLHLNYFIVVTPDTIIKREIDISDINEDYWFMEMTFDDSNVYAYALDVVIAFDRCNFNELWRTTMGSSQTAGGGFGPNIIAQNKLITIPFTSNKPLSVIDLNSGETRTYESESASAIQQIGDYIYWNEIGELTKFNLFTEEFESLGDLYDGLKYDRSWHHNFGISEKTMVLSDSFKNKWRCFRRL